MIDALRLLGYNKICSKFDYKELAVSTQSFIPPENTLLLLSGGLKVKVEGNISDTVTDNPYFDPSQPIRVILIYLKGIKYHLLLLMRLIVFLNGDMILDPNTGIFSLIFRKLIKM